MEASDTLPARMVPTSAKCGFMNGSWPQSPQHPWLGVLCFKSFAQDITTGLIVANENAIPVGLLVCRASSPLQKHGSVDGNTAT